MKKKVTLGISLGTVFLILAITIVIVVTQDIKIVKANDNCYIQKGINIDTISSNLENNKIIFKENNESNKFSLKELGITVNLDESQSEYINKSLSINLDKLNIKYNFSKLKEKLEKINSHRVKTKYPTLNKDKSKFVVSKQSIGNYVDINKLTKYIEENLNNNDLHINIKDFYESIDDTKPTYEELTETVNKVNETHIKYTNGFDIKLTDYIDYLKVSDNKVVIDEEQKEELSNLIDKTIEKELLEYDTVGKAKKFKTHSGEEIEITGGTWGNVFSSDKETEYILDKFSNFESEDNRTPIYSQEMSKEIGDTYIEVSIKEQHVWHYVNGKLCCESDCVTGKLDGKHATPTGVYYISERQNGRTLKPKGSTSGTWVNKWLRITWDGVGLHDAYWRSSFGGNIYTRNGSHGCINLPKSYAYSLFDEVTLNYCVIVH